MTHDSTARRGALALVPGPHQQLDVERIAIELAECRNVDTIRDVRERARAIELYQRKRNASIAAQQDAAEIALRAERRLGDLCRDFTGGSGRKKTDSASVFQTLDSVGITHKESSRWQKLAEMPERRFEDHVASVRAKGERLTAAGVIREVDKHPPEPEPFHPINALADLRAALDRKIAIHIAEWPHDCRPLVPDLLRSIALEMEARAEMGAHDAG